MRNRNHAVFLALFLAVLTGTQLVATLPLAASDKSLTVIARMFKFVQSSAGKSTVLVVDNGGGDATAISDYLAKNPKLGNTNVTAQLISGAELASVSGDIAAIIVPDSAGDSFASVNEAAKRLGTIAVSTGKKCVETSKCTLGIETDPRIQIYVSRSARQAHGVQFNPAFLVMAKEL